MVHAEVVAINQQLNFETRSMANILSLRLPDGTVINAEIDDDAAQAVIKSDVDTNGTSSANVRPASIAEAPVVRAPVPDGFTGIRTLDAGAQALVFGGDVDPGEMLPEEEDEPAPAQPVRSAPVVEERAPRVDKDDHGYPVIRGANTLSLDAITGTDDPDEDGVNQG